MVRLQMTPAHLHYGTTIHCFYCRKRATPGRNFSDTGIEASNGQADAESEVKTQQLHFYPTFIYKLHIISVEDYW
jgi:hypothetical protein